VEVHPADNSAATRGSSSSRSSWCHPIGQGTRGQWRAFYPPAHDLAVPYLIPNEDVGFHFYQRLSSPKLNEGLIRQQGVRMLSAASFGFRCFTNNKKAHQDRG